MIAQPQRAEAAGDPTQPFSRRMRIVRVRVSRAHNLTQQSERWIGELVLFQD
jgi:hypothetical protein